MENLFHNNEYSENRLIWSCAGEPIGTLLPHPLLIIFITFHALLYPQSNRIVKLECLGSLLNLEELYISHNGIEEIEGLDNLVSNYLYD